MKASIFGNVLKQALKPVESSFFKMVRSKNTDKAKSTLKEVDLQDIVENFPSNINGYNDAIDQYMKVGKSSPKEAIETLFSLFPFGKQCEVLDSFTENFKTHHKIFTELSKFILGYFFADCVAQLYSYAQLEKFEEISKFTQYLLDYKSDLSSQFKFLTSIHSKFLKQFAVIVGIASANSFDDWYTLFSIKLTEKNRNIDDLFCIMRYIRTPGDNQFEKLAKLYIDNLGKNVEAWSSLRFLVMQSSPTTVLGSQVQEIQALAKKTKFTKYANEINIIITAKSNIGTDQFAELVNKYTSNEKLSWPCRLRIFLYLLQGGIVHHGAVFWRRGEHNGLYDIDREVAAIWNTGLNHDFFTELLCKILDKLPDDPKTLARCQPILVRIILNFGARNIMALASIIVKYITIANKDLRRMSMLLPLLKAIAIMSDASSGFAKAVNRRRSTDVDEQLKTIITQMKVPLQNLLNDIAFSPANHALVMHNLSIYEVPPVLRPTATPPAGTEKGIPLLEKRIHLSRKLGYTDDGTIDFAIALSARASDDSLTIIHIVALMVLNANESDLRFLARTLVRQAESKEMHVAHFALYALQFLYIRRPEARRPILSEAVAALKMDIWSKKERIADVRAPYNFTLSMLLQQLLSTPYTPSRNEDKAWFDSWAIEIQAAIIIQLASPYAVIRFAAHNLLQRFGQICEHKENNLRENIAEEISTYVDTVGVRVRAQHPNLPAASFEEALQTRSSAFFALYLGEVCSFLCQNKFEEVVKSVARANPASRIRVFGGQKSTESSSIDKATGFLLAVIAFRLCGIPKAGADLLREKRSALQKRSFLTEYENVDPLVEKISDGRFKFITDNIPTLISEIVNAGKEEKWARQFISILIQTASGPGIMEFLAVSFHFLNKWGEKEKERVLEVVTEFIERILSSPDSQVQLLGCEASFGYIKALLANVQSTISSDEIKEASKKPERLESMKQVVMHVIRIVRMVSAASRPVFDPTASVSLKRPEPLNFAKNWGSDERKITMQWILEVTPLLLATKGAPKGIAGLEAKIATDVKAAIVAMWSAGKMFDSRAEIEKDNRISFAVEMNKVLPHTLEQVLLQNDCLFDLYIEQAMSDLQEGGEFFAAICRQWATEAWTEPTNPDIDEKGNELAFSLRGKLLIVALFYLQVSKYENRCLALSLIRRLLPVFSAMSTPDSPEKIALVSGFIQTRKGEFLLKSGMPRKGVIKQLCTTIFKNVDCIVVPAIEAAVSLLTTTNIITNISSQLMLVLECAAPFYELDNGKVVDSLVTKVFKKLQPAMHAAFARVIVALCERQTNRNVIIHAVFSFAEIPEHIDCISVVIHALIKRYSLEFLPRLSRPTEFGAWFYHNVWCHGREASAGYAELAIRVLEELAAAELSPILPVLHNVLHFCLIMFDDDHCKARLESVRRLLATIVRALTDKYVIGPTTALTYKESTSAVLIPVAGLVDELCTQLNAIVPQIVLNWQRTALQWATQCGDIRFARKSAFILCSMSAPLSASLDDIERAIYQIVSTSTEARTDDGSEGTSRRSTFIERDAPAEVGQYLVNMLMIIKKIVKEKRTAAAGIRKDTDVARFTLPFVYMHRDYPNVVAGAFRILRQFAMGSSSIFDELKLDQHIMQLGLLLSPIRNPTKILTFISALIKNTSGESADSHRALLIALILPAVYAAFCSSLSIDVYATSISDECVDAVYKSCAEIGMSRMGSCPAIPSIFARYFDDNSGGSKVPDDFVNEVAAQLAKNHFTELCAVLPVWSLMLQEMNDVTTNSIFMVATAVFKAAAEEKPVADYATPFENIIDFATANPKTTTQNFLYVLARDSRGRGDIAVSDGKKRKHIKPPEVDIVSMLGEVVSRLYAAKRIDGDFEVAVTQLPMLPLIETGEGVRLSKEAQEFIANRKLRPLPFEDEAEKRAQWLLMVAEQRPPLTSEARRTPAPEVLYIHSAIEYAKKTRAKKLDETLAPEFFMVFDGDCEMYFDRIGR